ncbi:hypothetical protein DNTS_020736 [Danionella cerebrum]|uniref:Small monomeric GTPase n=1 Tax=Danionella cerebrum TaxID=2873325 RepID=A0A553MP83_9TELE|nr:hypothetical protein DNTS_020736 [Danionella translucida]
MSGRRSKKSQKLGSSRRDLKVLNKHSEKDDDGGIAKSEHVEDEFDLEFSGQLNPTCCTSNPKTSELEIPQHAESQKGVVIEAKRKLGSTRKKTRAVEKDIKSDEMSEDVDEDQATKPVTTYFEEHHGHTEQSRSSLDSFVSFQPEISELEMRPGSPLSVVRKEKVAIHHQVFTDHSNEAVHTTEHSSTVTATESELFQENSILNNERKTRSCQDQSASIIGEVTDEATVIMKTVGEDQQSCVGLHLASNLSEFADCEKLKEIDILFGNEIFNPSVAFPTQPGTQQELDAELHSSDFDYVNQVLEDAGRYLSDSVPDSKMSYKDVTTEDEEGLQLKEKPQRFDQRTVSSRRPDTQQGDFAMNLEKTPSVCQHEFSLENNDHSKLQRIGELAPTAASSPHEKSDLGKELNQHVASETCGDKTESRMDARDNEKGKMTTIETPKENENFSRYGGETQSTIFIDLTPNSQEMLHLEISKTQTKGFFERVCDKIKEEGIVEEPETLDLWSAEIQRSGNSNEVPIDEQMKTTLELFVDPAKTDFIEERDLRPGLEDSVNFHKFNIDVEETPRKSQTLPVEGDRELETQTEKSHVGYDAEETREKMCDVTAVVPEDNVDENKVDISKSPELHISQATHYANVKALQEFEDEGFELRITEENHSMSHLIQQNKEPKEINFNFEKKFEDECLVHTEGMSSMDNLTCRDETRTQNRIHGTEKQTINEAKDIGTFEASESDLMVLEGSLFAENSGKNETEVKDLGGTLTEGSFVIVEPDLLQSGHFAAAELNTSNSSEKSENMCAVTGSKISLEHNPPEQLDKIGITSDCIVPENYQREERHSKMSPVVQKRKMGSTRRPLKGNREQIEGRELCEENRTLSDEPVIHRKKLTLKNQENLGECTVQSTKDGPEEPELCEVRPAEFSEFASLEPLHSRDLISEVLTVISTANTMESKILTNIQEESQEDPRRALLEYSSSEEQNKPFATLFNNRQQTDFNYGDDEMITDAVTMITESQVLQDSLGEGFKASHKSVKDIPGYGEKVERSSKTCHEDNLEAESSDQALGDAKSNFNPEQRAIPEEPCKNQAKLNLVIQKRKMGSTRKTLRVGKKEEESEKIEKEHKEVAKDSHTELKLPPEVNLNEESEHQLIDYSHPASMFSHPGDRSDKVQQEIITSEKESKIGSTQRNLGKGCLQQDRNGEEKVESIDTDLQLAQKSGEQEVLQQSLMATSQSSSNFELIVSEPYPKQVNTAIPKTNEEEHKVSVGQNVSEIQINKDYIGIPIPITSSQQAENINPTFQETASPSTKRKFGSRRANKGKQGFGRLPANDDRNELEDGDSKSESIQCKHRQDVNIIVVSEPCLSSQPQTPHQNRNEETSSKVQVDEAVKHNRSPGTMQTIHLTKSAFDVVQFNVVAVGNSCVGKTSFIRRFHDEQFTEDYRSTIGVDTFMETIALHDRTVKLQIWDTAGQERFHSITRQVFHKADGILIMYDITNSKSFISVRDWITQARVERAPEHVVMMLLGNKSDSVKRQVQFQEGMDLAREYNIDFMECSAATAANVSEAMKALAELLVQQKTQKEEHLMLRRDPRQNKSGCC